MHPRRLHLFLDLVQELGLAGPEETLPPRAATAEELRLVHTQGYLELVRRSSEAGSPVDGADLFGLGSEDNPVYPGLHEAAALIAGGAVTAAERIMAGELDHVFHPAGGLHHAHRSRASGFCIYNDAAVAIAALENRFDARVAYVDLDAHHGDGVQFAFYDDPDVLTISFHETGRFLFPGSGEVLERGLHDGQGYAVNVPLEPFTEDDSFLEAFAAVVPPLLRAFHPDFLVSQHGCDGHYLDTMSDLAYTTRAYAEATALLHALAHELCAGRWLALGGGGYEAWDVVPRAWAVQWAELAGRPQPADTLLPEAWRRRWQTQAPRPLPERLGDRPGELVPPARRAVITEKNRRTAEAALAGSFLQRLTTW
ncbi:MAG TPA: acetoin utilization protein AcuC [Firmicutes bacterium]|nr:acetoin utilization protein AcuC [Bacillota bacterium]